MARCARNGCRRWRPDPLIKRTAAGLSFNGAWYCSSECVEADARALLSDIRHHASWVSPPHLPVGRLLIRQHAIDRDALERALESQRQSGRRLGAELVALGLVTPRDVLAALAAQWGVGYLLTLDSARVLDAPGGLPPHAVRALRAVPFECNDPAQRLRVACTAPLPREALAALREITGYLVEPFLVPEELLELLLAAYGRGHEEDGQLRGTSPAASIGDAAARIARAAREGAAQRMHNARCDSYVWVRLEGDARVEDLLVNVRA